MKMERRKFERKDLDPLEIQGIIALDSMVPIADGGRLIQASTSDFCLEIKRENLCDPVLRKNLNLDKIHGLQVSIFIPSMDLDITGTVSRTKYRGKSGFEVGVNHALDAPLYWRECLCELLPRPGEIEK